MKRYLLHAGDIREIFTEKELLKTERFKYIPHFVAGKRNC